MNIRRPPFSSMPEHTERSGQSSVVTRSTSVTTTQRVARADGFDAGKKPGLLDKLADAAKMTRVAAQAARSLWAEQTGTLEVWPDRSLPDPPPTRVIQVASYNVRLGDRGVVPVAEELSRLGLDALFVQDCPEEAARALGRILKMHIAFSSKTQKAIFTRHPIVLGEETPFERKWGDRIDAARAARDTEPLLGRSILRIHVSVGGERPVDLVDVHLSVKEPLASAGEVAQLTAYMEERAKAGGTVVLAGDFKSNTVVAEKLQHGWHAGAEQKSGPDESSRLAAQAQAELASGKVEKGTPRYRQLLAVLKIADTSASRRFDNLRVSKDVAIRSFIPDELAARSQHPPLFSEIRW